MEDARVENWSGVRGLVHGFGRRDPAPTTGELFLMKQVHGTRIVTPPWTAPPEADAAATTAPAFLLGIKTADCLPILFVDPRRRLAAAAHAGWRGTAGGIAAAVVDWLLAQGSSPADLLVALGPCIGSCCYEVGDELRSSFAATEQPFFIARGGGKPHLDLRGVNAAQLRARGVPPANISRIDECTSCRADLYHSYRREGAAAGRMVSYVGWSRA